MSNKNINKNKNKNMMRLNFMYKTISKVNYKIVCWNKGEQITAFHMSYVKQFDFFPQYGSGFFNITLCI